MVRIDEPARVRRWAVEQVTRKGARVEAVAAALGYGRSRVFGWVHKYSGGTSASSRPSSARGARPG